MDQEHPNMDIGYGPAFAYICIAVLLEGRVAGLLRAAAATSGLGTDRGTTVRRANETAKTNRRATNRKSHIFQLICFTRTRASSGCDLRARRFPTHYQAIRWAEPILFSSSHIFFLVYLLLGCTIRGAPIGRLLRRLMFLALARVA